MRRIQAEFNAWALGVDGAVRCIQTDYEVRGMAQKVTSYDNPVVGAGSVVNQVQLAYNNFGQLIADYQSPAGAVNTASTPQVRYSLILQRQGRRSGFPA